MQAHGNRKENILCGNSQVLLCVVISRHLNCTLGVSAAEHNNAFFPKPTKKNKIQSDTTEKVQTQKKKNAQQPKAAARKKKSLSQQNERRDRPNRQK